MKKQNKQSKTDSEKTAAARIAADPATPKSVRDAIARITKAVHTAVEELDALARLQAVPAKSTRRQKAAPSAKPARSARPARSSKPANAAIPAKPLTDAQIASKAKKVPRRTPDGVFVSDAELTVFAGAYAMKAVAEREAQEFLNTDVLRNRTSVFPDFRRYKILPTVVSARVVNTPSDVARQWRLLVTVDMAGGTKEARLAWAGDVVGRCRAFAPAK